jgi:hypothetical protein
MFFSFLASLRGKPHPACNQSHLASPDPDPDPDPDHNDLPGGCLCLRRVLGKIPMPEASATTQCNTYVPARQSRAEDADRSLRLGRQTIQVRLLRGRIQTTVSLTRGHEEGLGLTPRFPEMCCDSTARRAPPAWHQDRRCQAERSRASESSPATTAPRPRKRAISSCRVQRVSPASRSARTTESRCWERRDQATWGRTSESSRLSMPLLRSVATSSRLPCWTRPSVRLTRPYPNGGAGTQIDHCYPTRRARATRCRRIWTCLPRRRGGYSTDPNLIFY